MTDYKKELFNYKKLSYIIQKWDELGLPEECKRDWAVHNHLTGKTFYVNPLTNMREYLSGAIKTKKYGYVRNVSYHQSKSSKESGYILGRRYVKDGKGLQSFNHIIRNTISGEFYDDIDIVNAHSSLLSQLCKKKGWCCKYVDYYNDNREECLKSMMDTDATKTRKDCKTTVIVAMYNNGKVSGFYGLKWFDEFKANIQIIQDEMAKDPEFKAEYKFAVEKNKNKAPEKQNVLGSMCSLIMNRYENDILKKAEEYLKIYKGFETTNIVYAFDGFQFNKGKITNEIMRELESYIEKETGWKIDYIIKPMNEVIELPDLNDIEIDEDDYGEYCGVDSYEDLKRRMEKIIVKIMIPACFIQIRPDGGFTYTNKTNLMTAYEDVFYKDGEGRTQKFLKRWFEDPKKIQYEYETFDPSRQCNSNVYNSFKGFYAENVKPSKDIKEISIDVILNHFTVLFKEHSKYVLSWLAQIIQFPHKKPTVCLLLYSNSQGVGKSILFEYIINKILGKSLGKKTADAQNDLFSKHSNAVPRRLLVCLEEAQGSHFIKNMDKFKELITCDVYRVEPKGIDAFDLPNYCSFVAMTNNDNPIPIDSKDRRFCAFDCDNDKCGDVKYFKTLAKAMEDDDIAYAFFKYLKDYKIDIKDFQKERPITVYYENVREANLPNWVKWLCFLTQNVNPTEWTAMDLYSHYKGFCEIRKLESVSNTKFGLNLKKVDGIEKYKSNYVMYGFDWKKVEDWLVKEKKWEDDVV